MTDEFRVFDVVKVARLQRSARAFDGTVSVARPPRVGDIGAIVHQYDAEDGTVLFAVEMVDQDGVTVWVADFGPDELELVSSPGSDSAV